VNEETKKDGKKTFVISDLRILASILR